MRALGIMLSLAIVLVLNGSALVPLATGAQQKDTSKESEIAGNWVTVSVVEGGVKLKGVSGDKVIIEGDRITQEPEKAKYRLDPTKKPKQIDIIDEESKQVLKGIYAIEGDTLKICYAKDGEGRPTEFASKKGTGISLRILKRDKK